MSIPYDAKRTSLYKPGEAQDFFKPGTTTAQDFLNNEAALCAEMSRLAYVKEESRLVEYLERAGFTKDEAIGYTNNGTQVFIACKRDGDNTLAIVVFRGTEGDDPSDLFADAKFLQQAWFDDSENSLGLVHKGFAQALLDNNILERIKTSLDKTKPTRILITGHSLGAALATLTASRISADHLYTFGSCRVGDAAFAQTMQNVNHTRFVDCCDIVTRLPPEMFNYVHMGSLKYIDRNGKLLSAPFSFTIFVDCWKARSDYEIYYALITDKVLSRDFTDHAPINYVSGVMGLRA